MKSINETVSTFKESIFATMSKLASQTGAINLSQGYPDFDGPDFALQAITKACQQKGRLHQYAPFPGTSEFRDSLTWLYQNYYQLSYCPQEEITVVNGATEGIFSSLLALLNPGDEVIVFEPFYDSYLATIQLAKAVAVPVTLHAPEFKWDSQELKDAFSEKTKLVILNNPHNPSGRVFNRKELSELSKLIIENDCYAFSDEVYEFLTYDKHEHIPLASLSQMRERTLITSSLGKTFGFTGWKMGWVVAPPALTKAVRMVHQFNTFSVNHPFQEAAAHIIKKLPDYIPKFQETYQRKRDFFLEGMHKAGYTPFVSQGTYFSLCPIPEDKNDIEYCEHLIKNKKVAAIPPSAFYLNSEDGKKYLRFCFAKKDETLQDALLNLQS